LRKTLQLRCGTLKGLFPAKRPAMTPKVVVADENGDN
jgi:hypothetical protein